MTGAIVLDSTNLTAGDSTSNANKIRLGASNDLNIHHDGSNSYIEDSGTGALRILGSVVTLKNPNDNEVGLTFTENAAIELYYNNAKKFETTNLGVSINGTAIVPTDTDTSNSGNITLNFADFHNFVLTLTGNIVLVNPTTEQVGQSGMIVLIQDGTGSRTLAVGDQYFGPGGDVPEISTGANSIDVIPYFVQAAGKILLGEAQQAFADAS